MSRKSSRRLERVPDKAAHLVVMFNSTQYSEQEAVEHLEVVRCAWQRLRDGVGSNVDFNTVSVQLTVADVRAQAIENNAAARAVLDAGSTALAEAVDRHAKIGRYGFDASQLVRVDAALEVFQTILRASSPRQMQTAQELVKKEVQRMLIRRKEKPG